MGTGLSIQGERVTKEVLLALHSGRLLSTHLARKLQCYPQHAMVRNLRKYTDKLENFNNEIRESQVTLQGDPRLCKSLVSLKAMNNIIKAILGSLS